MLRADTEARCKKAGKTQLSQLSRVPQFVCFTSLAVSFMTQCHKCHNCPFTSLAVSFMTHCQNCYNCHFTALAVSFMTQCITMQQPSFGARSGWEELAGVQQPLGWTLQIPSWGVQQSSSSCHLDFARRSAREADVVSVLMELVLPMIMMPVLPMIMSQSCQ